MLQSGIESLVNSLLDDKQEEQEQERWRKVVSIRLRADDIHNLDQVARALGLTRTGCATLLLDQALSEALVALTLRGKMPPGQHVHFEQDETGTITATTEDGKQTIIKDDALMISEEDRP